MHGYFFIIDAMVTLPFVKISHEKNNFLVNLPCKCHFWKIYHENIENLPFYGDISIAKGILGKFPFIYGDTVCLEMGVNQVLSWRSRGYSGHLLCRRLGVQILQDNFRNLTAKFPPGYGNFEIKAWKFRMEYLQTQMKMLSYSI
jgi:hypothetical protein